MFPSTPPLMPSLRLPDRQRMLVALAILLLLSACGQGGEAAVGPGMMALPVTVIEMQPQRVPIVVEAVGQANTYRASDG